jgi:hypothetical protein
MEENKGSNQVKKSSNGLRLTARITGTLWVAVIVFINIGYLIEGYNKNGGHFVPPKDYLGVATLVTLYIGLTGLIIAFWQTGLGTLLSITGFVAAAIFLIIDPKLNFSIIAFLIILIPSVLYLAYWWDTKNYQNK